MPFPDIDATSIIAALGLTLIAGMATAVGSLLTFFKKSTNVHVLSCALGLSAGVMVYVSFMDLLPHSASEISEIYPGKAGEWLTLAAFFGGIALIAIIDWLIPENENPHEMHKIEELPDNIKDQHTARHLRRTGFMVACAIAVHNFPEGVATFVAALDGMEVAIPIVVAIAIHNIPEGIAVSFPIYHATGNRLTALRWALLAGLAEPAGALVAIAVLLPLWNEFISGIILAAVAGIMVYISIDELLPSAEKYGHHHWSIFGFIAGMLIMALSLIAF